MWFIQLFTGFIFNCLTAVVAASMFASAVVVAYNKIKGEK